ncbi:MAG: DUF1570 domain-containing protein [Planctomycetota bacterium]
MAAFIVAGCVSAGPAPVLHRPSFSIQSYDAATPEESTTQTIECILKHYCNLFDIPNDRLDPLTIVLGSRKAGYGVDEFPALYQCSTSSIHFHRQPDTMLLLHEIAHHFVKMRYGDRIPIWLNEGIATYLGWSAMDEDHLAIGEIPVIHFKTVKEMSLVQKFIPLDHFLGMKATEFYDSSHSARHYSQAWGLVFFMLHGFFPDYYSFRRKLDLIAEMPEAELAKYEPLYQRFCRDFSAAQLMQERLYTDMPVRRLSSAFRLGLLQDDGSLESLLRQVRNRDNDKRFRIVALYASAMIAIRASDPEAGEELKLVLLTLKYQPKEEISSEAGELHAELERDELKKIVRDFVSLSDGSGFYPASRFRGDGG